MAHGPNIAFGLGFPFTSSVCAKLIEIIAVAPTIEPELRSIPPVMMTCVTPSAMIPMIDTWRMMILIRAMFRIVPSRPVLKSKSMLWPFM